MNGRPRLRLVLAASMLMYVVLSWWQAHYHQAILPLQPLLLPKSLQGQWRLLEGRVVTIPRSSRLGTGFVFKIHNSSFPRLRNRKVSVQINGHERPAPRLGEHWRLWVKLKAIQGRRNSGLSSSPSWAAAQGILASAATSWSHCQQARLPKDMQVSAHQQPGSQNGLGCMRLAKAKGVTRLRATLRSALQAELPASLGRALLLALALGDRSEINDVSKAALARAGLSHLLAVSGMHIALMAGIGWLIGRWMWVLVNRLRTVWVSTNSAGIWFDCSMFASCLALGMSSFYALLSGLALSTIRALLAITVILSMRHYSGINRWGLGIVVALVGVLCIRPFAALAVDFWLSFGAVFWLFAMFSQQRIRPHSKFRELLAAQVLLSLATMPTQLTFTGSVSVWPLLLNLVAVPLVTTIVMPLLVLVLIALLMDLPWPSIWLAELVGFSFEFLLSLPARWSGSFWFGEHKLGWTSLTACLWLLGLLSLVLPMLVRLRLPFIALFGLVWLLPLNRPSEGGFWIDVLDVGRGSAVIVRTRHSTMAVDVGPQTYIGTDAGAQIVAPFLQKLGITALDLVVLSHLDQHHIGGFIGVGERIAISQVYAPVPLLADERALVRDSMTMCKGQSWFVDGVRLTVLSTAPYGRTRPYDANNFACLLRIENGRQSVVMLADINTGAEQWLLRQNFLSPADGMLVPNHASLASSSTGIINRIKPAWAVVSGPAPGAHAGPSRVVLERYARRQVLLHITGMQGNFAWRSE